MIPLHQCIPSGVAELLRRQPLTPAKVTFAWRMSVGPAIDRSSRIALLETNELEVVVADVHWQREIERSRGLVMARLETLLGPGTVRRILVRVPDGRSSRRRARNEGADA
jgi:hypothetical protein